MEGDTHLAELLVEEDFLLDLLPCEIVEALVELIVRAGEVVHVGEEGTVLFEIGGICVLASVHTNRLVADLAEQVTVGDGGDNLRQVADDEGEKCDTDDNH